MGAEGLQRYADQFIELASRLRWGLDEENTIYQFKAGLLPWLAEQLSAAEANFNLMRKVSGLDEASVSVDLLMKMGLSIEANRDLQSKTSQNSGKIASRENNSKGSYGTNGKGPYPPCDHCGKRSHPAKDCWNKRADDSKGSTAPRNDSAMLKNNKPINTQALKSTDARKSPNKTSERTDISKIECFRCGKLGHYLNRCLNREWAKAVTLKDSNGPESDETTPNSDLIEEQEVR